MMSCSIFGSNTVALATAMAALSGTVIFLAFTQILGTVDSPPQNHTLRSCLSSSSSSSAGGKKKKKKKRVRFAESVKMAVRNGDDYRKGRQESVERRRRRRSCRGELISEGMPANRGALYRGMMIDRMNRMEWLSSC